jgi:hypothetical protein
VVFHQIPERGALWNAQDRQFLWGKWVVDVLVMCVQTMQDFDVTLEHRWESDRYGNALPVGIIVLACRRGAILSNPLEYRLVFAREHRREFRA